MNSWIILCLIINGIFSLFFALWNTFTAVRTGIIKDDTSHLKYRELRELYLIIPCLNEESVIAKSLKSALDVAHEITNVNVEIIVIDDGSDDRSPEIIKNMSDIKLHKIFRRLPHARQGKGVALNTALEYISHQKKGETTTLLGIIDGDSTVTLEYVMNVIYHFNHSNRDLIQTSVCITNRKSFIATMQNFEFTVSNTLTQVLRSKAGCALASGNGQFCTLKMAKYVKWGTSLLDDLEFSLKGILSGYYGIFITQNPIEQQPVYNFRQLIKQRTRWCQGGLQCIRKYLPNIWQSKANLRIKFFISMYLFIPIFCLVIFPTGLISCLVFTFFILKGHYLVLLLPILLLLLQTLISLGMIHSCKKYLNVPQAIPKWYEMLKICLLIYPYIWTLSWVPYIALTNIIKKDNSWNKTQH